jgi:hypothetical protein
MQVKEVVRIRIWFFRTVLALLILEIKGCEIQILKKRQVF